MIQLETKVALLPKVGKVLAAKLKKLGIETVKDLIFYYPFRYDDFTRLLKISEAQAGLVVTIRGRVEILASRRSRYKRKFLTEGIVADDSGSIKVIWFNQPWISQSLKVGDEVYLSGKISGDLFNLYLSSPSYEKASGNSLNTNRLVPVYPATEGVSQKQLRYLVKTALSAVSELTDWLPGGVIKDDKLWALNPALKQIHFPTDWPKLKKAKERLAFEEMFLIQVWSQMIKKELADKSAPAVKFFEPETKALVDSLPFQLTNDQKKSAWEILKDLQKNQPMNRLLNGDVGSGKTIVVLVAFFNAILSGYQSALMAPTEILARQHFENFKKLLNKFSVQVGLLTSSQIWLGDCQVSKKEFLEKCQKGEIQIIIGTHALIQKDLAFKKLGLVAVDEQHRFGVEQRQLLKQKYLNVPLNKKGEVPHFLSLTATPIPRSLALSIFGDLDLSIIREMPKDRKKIITKIVSPDKRQLAYEFILKQIKAGRQIFVICPLIDPSDKLGVRSVKEEFEKLDQQVFPDIKVGLLHGRLKPAEKEKAMADFASNKTKILVSTSVVEVGVDIPNASVMMIEGAERFGLSQLHQFRGRVGRSEHQSYCFLFTDSSEINSLERLQALSDSQDGFVLAQRDLEQRGAGSVYGLEQSGFAGLNLRMADLSDLALIKKARAAAQKIVMDDDLNKYPNLVAKINSLELIQHLE